MLVYVEEGFGLVPASVGSFLSSVTLCSQLCYSIQSNPIQGITSLFTPNQPFDFLSGLVVKPSFLLAKSKKGSLCGVPHFQPEKAVKSESGHYSAPDTKPLYHTTTYIHTYACSFRGSCLPGIQVRLWDVVKSRELGRLSFMGHSHPVRSLACSSDGNMLVSGGDDHKVCTTTTGPWGLGCYRRSLRSVQ